MKKLCCLFLALGMLSGSAFATSLGVATGTDDVIEAYGGTRNGGDC